MFRIDTADATETNQFTDTPEPGQNATTVSAAWLNAVQEELVGLLEGNGINPAKANSGQIAALIASLTSAASILTKLKTVDGAASGLDADLLQGLAPTRFFRDGSIAAALIASGQSVKTALAATTHDGLWYSAQGAVDTPEGVSGAGNNWIFKAHHVYQQLGNPFLVVEATKVATPNIKYTITYIDGQWGTWKPSAIVVNMDSAIWPGMSLRMKVIQVTTNASGVCSFNHGVSGGATKILSAMVRKNNYSSGNVVSGEEYYTQYTGAVFPSLFVSWDDATMSIQYAVANCTHWVCIWFIE